MLRRAPPQPKGNNAISQLHKGNSPHYSIGAVLVFTSALRRQLRLIESRKAALKFDFTVQVADRGCCDTRMMRTRCQPKRESGQ